METFHENRETIPTINFSISYKGDPTAKNEKDKAYTEIVCLTDEIEGNQPT